MSFMSNPASSGGFGPAIYQNLAASVIVGSGVTNLLVMSQIIPAGTYNIDAVLACFATALTSAGISAYLTDGITPFFIGSLYLPVTTAVDPNGQIIMSTVYVAVTPVTISIFASNTGPSSVTIARAVFVGPTITPETCLRLTRTA